MEVKQITAQETWLLRHRVMWPDRSIDYVKLPDDDQGVHFGVFDQEVLVSVVSLFIVNGEAQFRKLATEVVYQRKGLASKLLTHIFEFCMTCKVDRIWCNARSDKTEFYKKFGMEETRQTFTKGGIDYRIMEYISIHK